MAQLSNAGAASSSSQGPPDFWERMKGYYRPSMLIVLGVYCKLFLLEWSVVGVVCNDWMVVICVESPIVLLKTNNFSQTSF